MWYFLIVLCNFVINNTAKVFKVKHYMYDALLFNCNKLNYINHCFLLKALVFLFLIVSAYSKLKIMPHSHTLQLLSLLSLPFLVLFISLCLLSCRHPLCALSCLCMCKQMKGRCKMKGKNKNKLHEQIFFPVPMLIA